MTVDERIEMLDLNERLCREYNETDDPSVLEKIAATEILLFYDPNHVVALETDDADLH